MTVPPALKVPDHHEALAIRAIGPKLAVRLFALAGCGLVIAATFVPTNGGGRAGYPYAIFDASIQREFQLYAAEPVAAAVLAVGAAFVLLRRSPSFAAGVLLALGVQSLLLFSAHVGVATFGNPQYNSFRPGGLLGMAGALVFITAGLLALRRGGSRAGVLGRRSDATARSVALRGRRRR